MKSKWFIFRDWCNSFCSLICFLFPSFKENVSTCTKPFWWYDALISITCSVATGRSLAKTRSKCLSSRTMYMRWNFDKDSWYSFFIQIWISYRLPNGGLEFGILINTCSLLRFLYSRYSKFRVTALGCTYSTVDINMGSLRKNDYLIFYIYNT